MNKVTQFLKQVGLIPRTDVEGANILKVLDSTRLNAVMEADLSTYNQKNSLASMQDSNLSLLLSQFDWSTDFNKSIKAVKDAQSLFNRNKKTQYVSYAVMLLNQLQMVVDNNTGEELNHSICIELDDIIHRYQIVQGSQHVQIQWLKNQGLNRLTSKVKSILKQIYSSGKQSQINPLFTNYQDAVVKFKALNDDVIIENFLVNSPEVGLYQYLFGEWKLQSDVSLEQCLSSRCTRHFTGTNLKADLIRWYISIRFYFWWSTLAYSNYNASKDALIDNLRAQLVVLKQLYPHELDDWYVLDQHPYLEFIANQDVIGNASSVERMLFILPKVELSDLYQKQMQILLGQIANTVNKINAKFA